MTSQDLDGVWTVLATTPPKAGIVVASAGSKVTAGDVLLGVDHENRRHLLIPLLPGEAGRTDSRGRGVHVGRIAHGNTTYLTVCCLLPELQRVFTQFCRELIVTIADTTSPAKEAISALERWRALFSDAERRGQISDEKLTGLVGELLVVEQLLAAGAPGDLRFWVGPFKELHDLRTTSHAIEVKTTLVREGRIVSISSIDQLQTPSGADLFLVHTRLDRDPSGISLSDLVDRVLDAGAHRDQLNRRLAEEGVGSGDLTVYADRKFKVADSRTYDVDGLAFPRMLRSSFAVGDIPPGTLRISYAIDLTNEPPDPLGDEAVSAAFEAFAAEATREVDS